MYGILVLAALAPAAPEADKPSGTPPEQVLASIDAKGNLTITHVTCTYTGPGVPEVPPPPGEKPGADKAPARPKVKVTNLMVMMAEMAAKDVQAYTTGGRAIPAEKLAALLAKERTVLVALDGKKVDPFHLQLYKEDTIVLVPPTPLNMGGGYYPQPVGWVAPAATTPVLPGTAPN
jgi:hypothetical protein